jgi:general nucleoside transport system ATP-binding protein
MTGRQVVAETGGASGASPVPALEARGITKRFGATIACDRVDLRAMRGEIHGILGQNGAGKTTLMNAFLGLVTPDAGTILLNGRPVAVRDPIEAASLGLAMVHQHFSLIGPLSVWENLTLGEKGRPDKKRAARRIDELARRYALEVDPYARVDDLTTGQRQRVEIVKCLMRDPDVFILDEPTSVLTGAESLELFSVLRQVVQQENRAVLLISHKLDEVLHATDTVTIMRNGRVVARRRTTDTDAAELARAMIGREVSLRSMGAALGHLELDAVQEESAPEPAVDSNVVLAIHEASARTPDGRPLLDGLSLDVRQGEILGVAGVEGNGQKAIGDLLSSLLTLQSGTVVVGGKTVASGRAGAMASAGIGVIPEDRHVSGCVMNMSVAENLILGDIDSVSPRGFLDRRKLRRHAQQLITEFDITTSSVDAPFRSLSGGNQQRVVLARELSRNPRVLVASQPTRGLDVGAIEYMTARLRAVAESGVAVLLVSTELEEILDLSDRVVVIHRGRVVGEMARDEVDLERLGLMMGGQAA